MALGRAAPSFEPPFRFCDDGDCLIAVEEKAGLASQHASLKSENFRFHGPESQH
jgi:hypothetical protein